MGIIITELERPRPNLNVTSENATAKKYVSFENDGVADGWEAGDVAHCFWYMNYHIPYVGVWSIGSTWGPSANSKLVPTSANYLINWRLRVVQQEVTRIRCDSSDGVIHYSTQQSDDIHFEFAPGSVALETNLDMAGNKLPHGEKATTLMPAMTFNYTRIESPGLFAHPVFGRTNYNTWGFGASGDPAFAGSQQQRVLACVGTTNQDLFLGSDTGTWLFLGAQAREHIWGEAVWRVTYNFAYKQTGWDLIIPTQSPQRWQYRDADGVLHEIYRQQNWRNILQLTWRNGTLL